MDYAIEVKSLRNDMGMNRMEFCEYFQIPYRTVVDWEAGNRKMPSYVLRLMQYKAIAENMCVNNKDNPQDQNVSKNNQKKFLEETVSKILVDEKAVQNLRSNSFI